MPIHAKQLGCHVCTDTMSMLRPFLVNMLRHVAEHVKPTFQFTSTTNGDLRFEWGTKESPPHKVRGRTFRDRRRCEVRRHGRPSDCHAAGDRDGQGAPEQSKGKPFHRTQKFHEDSPRRKRELEPHLKLSAKRSRRRNYRNRMTVASESWKYNQPKKSECNHGHARERSANCT